jgi:hypothetical protein
MAETPVNQSREDAHKWKSARRSFLARLRPELGGVSPRGPAHTCTCIIPEAKRTVRLAQRSDQRESPQRSGVGRRREWGCAGVAPNGIERCGCPLSVCAQPKRPLGQRFAAGFARSALSFSSVHPRHKTARMRDLRKRMASQYNSAGRKRHPPSSRPTSHRARS